MHQGSLRGLRCLCSGRPVREGTPPVRAPEARRRPSCIRVIWVVITVLTGFVAGIVIYILLWIILPEQGQARPVEAPPAEA